MDQNPGTGGIQPSQKITHTGPGFGREVPLGGSKDMPIAEGAAKAPKTIRAFEREEHAGSQWQRQPNVTGDGACHVRTFHAKMTDEGMKYMDDSINEWLDANPGFEVKFCSITVGEVTGKLKEPHLICQVWV